jgi:hypothetical protein
MKTTNNFDDLQEDFDQITDSVENDLRIWWGQEEAESQIET